MVNAAPAVAAVLRKLRRVEFFMKRFLEEGVWRSEVAVPTLRRW
jgi:hypothetical protein